MDRLIKFTLLAAARHGRRRGEWLTTPEGSELDRELTGDPAWARTVIPGARIPVAAGTRVQNAFATLVGLLREQVHALELLTREERAAYRELVHGARSPVASLARIALPGPPEEDPDDAEDATPTRRGAPDVAQADAGLAGSVEPTEGEPAPSPSVTLTQVIELAGAMLDGSDGATTVAALADAATSAGLVLPGKLPRGRAQAAELVLAAATDARDAIDPSDLGD